MAQIRLELGTGGLEMPHEKIWKENLFFFVQGVSQKIYNSGT